MATKLGKLLVLLNAFASIGILSWALSAYLNRHDSELAVDEKGEKLTDKVKRLNGELNTAQSVFGPEFAAVSTAEVRLADVQAKIAARLQEAQTGVFFNIFDDKAAGPDPSDPNGLSRVRRVLWGQLPAAKQIKGVGGTPLKGIEAMQKDLTDEGAKIAAKTEAIKLKVETSNTLSDEIAGHDSRATRLKRIFAALTDETEYLGDQQVNWDVRIATLQRRNRQLQARLTDLGVSTKAEAAAPPALPPSAVTLTTPTR
jgi:hypothetical protein